MVNPFAREVRCAQFLEKSGQVENDVQVSTFQEEFVIGKTEQREDMHLAFRSLVAEPLIRTGRHDRASELLVLVLDDVVDLADLKIARRRHSCLLTRYIRKHFRIS